MPGAGHNWWVEVKKIWPSTGCGPWSCIPQEEIRRFFDMILPTVFTLSFVFRSFFLSGLCLETQGTGFFGVFL
jgi:hypothetical protein